MMPTNLITVRLKGKLGRKGAGLEIAKLRNIIFALNDHDHEGLVARESVHA